LTLGDGLVFVATANAVEALADGDGAPRWSVALERPLTAPLGWAHGRLYVLVEPGDLLAVRASDGQLAWRRDLGARAIHAAAGDDPDLVFLALSDGRLVALSSDTGEVRWERKVGGTLSRPATMADRVLVGSTDNFAYAFTRNGSLAWRRRTGGDVSGVAIGQTLAYIASLDNVVWAVEIGNGNQRWKRPTSTRPTFSPMVRGGSLVVPGARPAVTSFGAVTGAAQGSHMAPGELAGPPLLTPEMRPFAVALVTITREGVIDAVRPNSVTFHEAARTPLTVLPGRVLSRERLP
jgi:outer membrane protein assembly factor BamB